jgi:DNA primase
MFDASFIDQVRDQNDLVSVIGASVTLRKAGQNYMGLCPFHSEKSPSFSVSPGKQFYHCFGCGAHGDVIKWEMEYGGLGFVDALDKLAQAVGMRLPERTPPTADVLARREQQADMQWVLARASVQFQTNLRSAEGAIAYLRDTRGITGQTAKRFGLGWASTGLQQQLTDISRQRLVDAGLLVAPEDDSQAVRDRFHNRVMFPIHNEQGATVGFGGRVLDAGQPKYLNSAESEVFHKGRELYGLHLAKPAIRKGGVAIVVEGYMDVVMLHQHGDERAVAALGTSLTEQQATRLLRLADEVVFVFDGDDAGRKAADRAARIVLQVIPEGRRASFVTLPAEHDPDSCVKAYGIDAWRGFLTEQAIPLSRKVLNMLTGERDLSVPEERAALVAEAGELLGTIQHARLFQAALADEVAQLVGLRPKIVRQQARPAVAEEAAPESAHAPGTPRPDQSRSSFYRQFALLCALDLEATAAVPAELVDGFASLVSAWFTCAPQTLQERIVALTAVRDGALRRVIASALEGVRERAAFLNRAQLVDELNAITQVIHEDHARALREREAVALFA